MVGQRHLELVLGLLVLGPGSLAFALLAGQTFVLLLDGLVHGGALLVHLVLEHAAHAGDGISLASVLHLLGFLLVSGSFLLPHLLGGPLVLQVSVELHTLVVDCKSSTR